MVDFARHFSLPLSDSKTCIWHGDYREADALAWQWGFVAATSITVLGAEWPISKSLGHEPAYDKESRRVDEECMHLECLRHLPLHALEKMNLASAGCLATLSYVNPPTPVSAQALRLPSNPLAFPEILLHLAF